MAQTPVSQGDPVDSTFSLPFLTQLGDYLQPFAGIFPDRRLLRRFVQMVKGVIAASVPIVSRIAAAVQQSRDPDRTFHVAKRFYRWLTSPRFLHRTPLKPACAQTRALFRNETEPYTLSCWTSPIWRSLTATPLKPFLFSRPPGRTPGLAVGMAKSLATTS